MTESSLKTRILNRTLVIGLVLLLVSIALSGNETPPQLSLLVPFLIAYSLAMLWTGRSQMLGATGGTSLATLLLALLAPVAALGWVPINVVFLMQVAPECGWLLLLTLPVWYVIVHIVAGLFSEWPDRILHLVIVCLTFWAAGVLVLGYDVKLSFMI